MANRFELILLAGLLLLFMLQSEPASSEEGCVACHSDRTRMRELGHEQLYIGSEEVIAQTRMTAGCTDCHLGNPVSKTAEDAHKGMLTLAVADTRLNASLRLGMPNEDRAGWDYLSPRGDNRATQLNPKVIKNGKPVDNPKYRLVLWHDRNASTLAFNPVLAEKTCGRCHYDIIKSFLKSPMGGGRGAHTQSQYVYWTGPSGPQSCGLWLGVPTQPAQDLFTGENISLYNRHSTMQITEKTAYNNQRVCNQCHVGCLDCHLDVQKTDSGSQAKGSHTFIRKPGPLNCYGGGTNFSCHAGPLERRRGDGFLRAEFTQSAQQGRDLLNKNPDVHMQKGIVCVDCHRPNNKTGYHADLTRDVDCSRCHKNVVKEAALGPHRKVDCAACHLKLIGGYAFNFWSANGPKGKENPLTRIQDYSAASAPLIIRNPKGIWIPVHVVPHISGNVIAGEVKLSKRLLFRQRPDAAVDRLYFSNDSYAITGLSIGVDNNDHDTLVWLNIDRVAHSLGVARACDDCHGSSGQVIPVQFSGGSYKDVEDGEYRIVADKTGLRIADIKGAEGGPMPDGLKPFAGKWFLRGDFSLPPIKNMTLYKKIKTQYQKGFFTH